MIHIESDRIYSIYVRTNRHVQWQYADYCGRWATPEEAVEKAKERTPGDFEYMIQDLTGDRTYGSVKR